MASENAAQITAELCTFHPPRYEWWAIECFGAHLQERLNRLDDGEWEIFQVLPSQSSPAKYAIIARKPIEEDPTA